MNRQKLEDRYIAEFKQTHPNVTVNVTRQSAEKLIELVQTSFAAGKGPTMFNLSVNDEYPYIVAGRVAPMNYAAAGFKDAKDVISKYMPGSPPIPRFSSSMQLSVSSLAFWMAMASTEPPPTVPMVLSWVTSIIAPGVAGVEPLFSKTRTKTASSAQTPVA